MGDWNEYVTWKPGMLPEEEAPALCDSFSLAGTEVFFDDLVPRDELLCPDGASKEALLRRLKGLRARRGHASYWAWPTAFLTGRHREELYDRMGGPEGVRAYFGDETGEAIFSRWTAEYALCREAGLERYVFHLIDYAPIDGKWAFTLTREEILEGMGDMLSRFPARLEGEGLLTEDAPLIELENAGWGLEYGAQRADDFVRVLEGVEDPHGKLRVSWDVNHLLHAVGKEGFLLPGEEITAEMAALPQGPGLAQAWLEQNLLDRQLLGRVGSVHLSDRPVTGTMYFCRGKLASPWYEELSALPTGEEQEAYGVDIVLGAYDSHTPLGGGYLQGTQVRRLLDALAEENEGFAVLHELKNSKDIYADLTAQRAALEGGEG